MVYLKRITSLLYHGVQNLAYLFKERNEIVEVRILMVGLGLTLLALVYWGYLLLTDPPLYRTLASAAIVNAMGGRSLGIATCLSAGLPVLPTILYNFYVEAVTVLISYGFVVLIMRNVIQPKLFHRAVRQAEMSAQNQKTRVKKYGTIGLILFVIFPFYMTGPVVGSIIGYLLNYRPLYNFSVVLGATLFSIVVYSMAGNHALVFLNQYVEFALIRKWGAITAGVLILLFLIYHMRTIKAYLDRQDDQTV